MAMEYEVIIKGGDKAFNVFQNLNKISELSEKINKVYETIGSKSLPKVDSQLKNIKNTSSDLSKTFSSIGDMLTGNYSSALDKIKGETKNSLSGVFDTFNKGFSRGQIQGMGFFSSLSRGMSGVTKAFGAGTLSIKGIFAGLAVSLGPLLAAIAAVVAAVFTLKTMWKINFLGMQSGFNKFLGELKSLWGKFNVFFIQTLRKLEPLFKITFMPLIVTLKSIWTIFKLAFNTAYTAIQPVIDALTELSALFKTNNSELNIMKNITSALSVVFKVLGVVLKASFTPIVLIIKGIIGLIKLIQKGWEAFTESKAFKTINAFFEALKFASSALQKLVGVKPDAETTVNNTSTISKSYDNRQQNIIFNTSRATTPEEATQFANILSKKLA